MSKLIIDIVGLAGSGKSRLCAYIQEQYGFELYRPSDALRQYAAAHGLELTGRQDYVAIHHALIESDPLAIVEPVIVSMAERICMDGMRAPLPFLELKKQHGAILIYLDCPDGIRLQRIQGDTSRQGHRVAVTLEDLLADEAPDMKNPDRNLPNMVEMKQLADHLVDASTDFSAVTQQIDAILEPLLANQA